MITLRQDQEEMMSRLRASLIAGKRSPLVVAPTGWGKTIWFSFIAKQSIAKSKRVFIIVHRQELIDQISSTLDRFEVPHGFIAADYGWNLYHNVQVCSVQTMARRLAKLPKPDLLIQDEASHVTKNSTWGRVLNHWPGVIRIGVTATPTRLSGEALGDMFDDLLIGPPVRDLITAGTLSDYRLFMPAKLDLAALHTVAGDWNKGELGEFMDRPSIIGDAVATYRREAADRPALAFCASVEHSHHTAEAFNAAGFAASWLDGSLGKDERRRRVVDFRSGTLRVLTSCEILNEGFDVPGVEVGIFLRPTQSLTLWLQQVGRCMRAFPGKTAALLFDHASNSLRHGFPDDEREWTLAGSGVAGRKKQESPIRQCPKCYAHVPLGRKACSWCGNVFETKPREVKMEEGELAEINIEAMGRLFGAKAARVEQGRATDYESLKKLETQRGYKPGWAKHIAEARERKRISLSMQADMFRPKKEGYGD